MKKVSLTIFLLIAAITMSFAQDNKVDSKGLRKGEWFIMYKGDFLFYDYMHKLLNLDKMLVPERETQSRNEAKYFEIVNYKKGVKLGEFRIYSNEKKPDGNYPLLAKGNYVNGKIQGLVAFINGKTMEVICLVEYENGMIKDQEIKMNKQQNDTYNFNMGAYSKSHVDISKIKPVIKINRGVCSEQIGFDENFALNRFLMSESRIIRYIYGTNTKLKTMEERTLMKVIEYDFNMKLNGATAVYEETNLEFDTTSTCYYRSTFKNNKIDGKELYYYENGNLKLENTFNDGMLSSSIYYAGNGQPFIEANYKDGILNGKFIVYYLKNVPNLTIKAPCQIKSLNSDAFDIVKDRASYQIFKSTIPYLKKQGYKIITDGNFKFIEANYVNGTIQSPYHYFHSTGSKLYEGVVENCTETDYTWFDAYGEQISNKKNDEIKNYFIKWDITYDYYACSNAGCNKKETCSYPSSNSTNIPLPEDYWILETGLRPDANCSKTAAYIEPQNWSTCNNTNYRGCNKKLVESTVNKNQIKEEFSVIDFKKMYEHKNYSNRLNEFYKACRGEGFSSIGLKESLEKKYGINWYKDVKMRHNIE